MNRGLANWGSSSELLRNPAAVPRAELLLLWPWPAPVPLRCRFGTTPGSAPVLLPGSAPVLLPDSLRYYCRFRSGTTPGSAPVLLPDSLRNHPRVPLSGTSAEFRSRLLENAFSRAAHGVPPGTACDEQGDCRVGGDVAAPAPHRPVRARLTHTVPHVADSLVGTYWWTMRARGRGYRSSVRRNTHHGIGLPRCRRDSQKRQIRAA